MIRNSKNHYKIGYTRNIVQRVRTLRTASSEKLMLVGLICGNLALEREIQFYFKKFRLNGEWFNKTEALFWIFDSKYGNFQNTYHDAKFASQAVAIRTSMKEWQLKKPR